MLLFVGSAAAQQVQVPNVTFQCNADGAVMTDASGQIYYLGRSCDAYVPGKGSGQWGYTASGMYVDWQSDGMIFRYVQPDCPSLPFCR